MFVMCCCTIASHCPLQESESRCVLFARHVHCDWLVQRCVDEHVYMDHCKQCGAATSVLRQYLYSACIGGLLLTIHDGV